MRKRREKEIDNESEGKRERREPVTQRQKMVIGTLALLHHDGGSCVSTKYQVILKKVSFGIIRIILVSMEEKIFTVRGKHKMLSKSKFS